VPRDPGWSVRVKLTLSYAAFLTAAGVVLLTAVALFLLRYVPLHEFVMASPGAPPEPGPSRRGLLAHFLPTAAAALAVLLALGLAGGWILAGRMLAPLTRITDATRIAATGHLDHRIHLPGRRDEFRELADAFDAMLAQLAANVARERRFAANASHELRTPLAITQTLLDVARSDPARADSELDERLRAVNTRAIALTEALLLLSRADQRSFTPEPVELSLIAEEAAETLLPLSEKRGVAVEVCAVHSVTRGSHALLLQLTTNLVHNAIVHNLPEGGTVWVSASAGPDGAVLTVENTGAELSPEPIATFVEPFRRGADRVRSEHAGVGLGLAIVHSIAQAHGGTLTLAPRRAGGLSVTVRLPDGSPPAGPRPLSAAGRAATRSARSAAVA
jgi:two-component system, OmpR family, sensor histidine kinase VanS